MNIFELKTLIRECIGEVLLMQEQEQIDAAEEDYLYVDTSQIPNAGGGLFTSIDIYRGEIIAEFKGEILTHVESQVRKKESGDEYFMDLPNGKVLDCNRIEGFAKRANDAEGFASSGFKNNSRIELVNGKVCLVATKNIKTNSEIFTGYGKFYWKNFKQKHKITEAVNNELPKLVLLIGIPGSGKSTWINSNKSKWKNTIVVSPDDIRREIFNDVSSQLDNKLIFARAKDDSINAIEQGINVIVDATNVNVDLRKRWIDDIQSKVECKLQAKLFWIDKDKAYERIAADLRNKVDRSNVPKELIDKMYIQFLQSVKSLKTEGYEIIQEYIE